MPPVIPTRPALLAARLGDLGGWHLLVVCSCRSYPRSIPLDEVAADRGRRITLERVVARLRCKECGKPRCRCGPARAIRSRRAHGR